MAPRATAAAMSNAAEARRNPACLTMAYIVDAIVRLGNARPCARMERDGFIFTETDDSHENLPSVTAVMTRRLAVIGLAMLLCACSTLRFTYNNSESLLRYAAWDYFDVDSEQADILQQRFLILREWHRSSELPAYANHLHAAREKVANGVTAADVRWAGDTLRNAYRTLVQRAVQEAVPVLVTLRADQLRALEKRLAKDEARYIEQWMSGDEKSRHRKRVHRMVERFEEWAGELDSRQRSLVDRFVASHSAIYELRLNDRRRWQREAVSMIRQQRTVSTLSPPLSRLFVDPDASRNIEVSRELQRWESDFANLIVELDASMSREQRMHVVRRLERYAEDFRSLSGVPRPSTPAMGRTP